MTLAGSSSATAATSTAKNLIDAYKQMIVKAHGKNIRIYGATILPFNGNAYYNQYSESCRNTVNQWIRTKGNFDACIDFDKTMRDPLDSTRLVSTYQNDGLHPDTAGYRKMGESIDLDLFSEDLSTGVNEQFEVRPTGFALLQNYPNPFNPSTTISFSLPSRSFVSLKVFEVMGKEVATIVSEDLPAGNYSREWNAANMSSGTYYYRLQTGAFAATKEMLFLK